MSPIEQTPNRRERVREATRDEIKALARQQLAESGGASLALNAIARALGMVPSALYRYYPDRDALLTALIVDAFDDLRATVQAADDTGTSFGTRLLSTTHAYRTWALAHPIDFQLIFGAPIPGYHAPIEQTGPAMQRVFDIFLAIVQAAHNAGRLRPVPGYTPTALLACSPDDFFAHYSPEVMYSGVAGWATMQGVIALELNGHLRYSFSDPAALYVSQIQSYLTAIGLDD